MANPYLGEIRVFGFNFQPVGWALCNGQLLAINQYAALFSLLGTQYGGNGTTNFALPNLQGRMAIHQGNGFIMGEAAGATSVTLTQAQLPAHSHSVTADAAGGVKTNPSGAFIAETSSANVPLWRGGSFSPAATKPVNMAAGMIGATGNSQPVSIQNPFLVLNFCIALQGIFPSRS